MQPVLTAAQSRAFDKYLIEEIGISSLVLMENAARGALDAIADWQPIQRNTVIFCGTGNNGGDGLALARLICDRYHPPKVVIVGEEKSFSPDAKVQFDILKRHWLFDEEHIHFFSSVEKANAFADSPGIIIDALLGTGSHGKLRGHMAQAVWTIVMLRAGYSERKVLALDVPTGLDPDLGVYDVDPTAADIVRADRTVAMGYPKIGFYLGESKQFTGEVRVANLGASTFLHAFTREDAIDLMEHPTPTTPFGMPLRIKETSSKISRGQVLAICGSRGMTGAAILSGTAALRSGCGLVTVAVPNSERSLVAQAMPELLTTGLAEQEEGSPDISAWDSLQEHIERADVLLIGCGLRPLPGTAELLRKIISDVDKPMVIDAGGLGALVGHLDLLKKRTSVTVLTPHVGEIARLVKRPWKEVERERLDVAKTLASEFGVIVVMKGAPTYTLYNDRSAVINTTGNAGMATAGTGDVLAGMIASVMAQKGAPIAAVYLHGLAGDLAAQEKTQHGMTATDVIAYLPQAFKTLGIT